MSVHNIVPFETWTHEIEVNTLNATCVTTLPTHPTPAAFLECFDNYCFDNYTFT
jgi:hypothetical protein